MKADAPATDTVAKSGPSAGLWPLSVTMIAVTGSVEAVTVGVTAVIRGRDPCAGRDRHRDRTAVTAAAGGLPRSPRADGPGRFRVCSTR
jgi:hypothetical protein